MMVRDPIWTQDSKIGGQEAGLQAVDDGFEEGETGNDNGEINVDGGNKGGGEVVVGVVG